MYLINVKEGDFIRVGYKFKGPQKFHKVTFIEWASETSIRVHTEGGLYDGNPYSEPGVLRLVEGRWVHY
jgi:hypothetical protein